MVFSSPVFLFLLLPAVLFFYYIPLKKNRRRQNFFLTLTSLFFYAWGEPLFVFVMIGSILANWFLGLQVDRHSKNKRAQRLVIAATVVVNIGTLFVFKYLSFFVNTISNSVVLDIALPIGISFFTFQAMSYVFDVQRGRGEVLKNPLDVALYISFFPQLIAGPIVRYETIANQIYDRRETFQLFTEGTERFIVGLSKKVLLANTLSLVADAAFGASERTFALAWLGVIAYAFQIYFDFSGYSDMAIGLGKMFGFRLDENFNYPYISKSISEFWRRWHISLGTWFRDYVYFPLGGSRGKTKAHVVLNLFIVWFLTGVWHGANWTFFIWGLMYFVLIATEKMTGLTKILGKFGHIYTMLFVMIGWAIFRAENVTNAIDYIGNMFGFGVSGIYNNEVGYWLHEYRLQFVFACVFSLPTAKIFNERLQKYKAAQIGYQILMCTLLLFTITSMLGSSYNPFIYFNF